MHHSGIFLKDRLWLKKPAAGLPSCLSNKLMLTAAWTTLWAVKAQRTTVSSKSGNVHSSAWVIGCRVLKKKAKWRFILNLKLGTWEATCGTLLYFPSSGVLRYHIHTIPDGWKSSSLLWRQPETLLGKLSQFLIIPIIFNKYIICYIIS